MRITYIHHSCFSVELNKKVLIFDYFRGERMAECAYEGRLPDFPRDREIYVFSSHQHRDHFDLEIFRWQEIYPNIHYILPKEIRLGDNYLKRNGIDPAVKERIYWMKPGEVRRLGNGATDLEQATAGEPGGESLTAETLRSTDEGVAFLVTCEGRSIYHAGDLHWWHWEGEEDTFNAWQEETYKSQIHRLEERLAGRALDAAFVVLDPRLGEAAFWGMDYFMTHVKARYVLPMHLWQRYELIEQYKRRPEAEPFQERILAVTGENQVFEVE